MVDDQSVLRAHPADETPRAQLNLMGAETESPSGGDRVGEVVRGDQPSSMYRLERYTSLRGEVITEQLGIELAQRCGELERQ